MPFAADQGRPLDLATSWTFLAVMSTARAEEDEKAQNDPGIGLGTDYSQRYGSGHALGGYCNQVLRSRGQVRLSGFSGRRREKMRKRTFMMGQDAAGNLHLCTWYSGRQIGRCRLQEEKGFFRNCIVEFFDVVEVVSTDSNNLPRT